MSEIPDISPPPTAVVEPPNQKETIMTTPNAGDGYLARLEANDG